MSKQMMIFTIITLSFVVAAAPAFAQGKGLGVGVGSQTTVGVGTGTRVEAPGVKAGAKTDVDVATKTSAHANVPEHGDGGKAGFVGKIEGNPNMSARVQTLLPAGQSLSQAAAGFKNEGQFLAALNVAHNLNIPFDQLKANLTGSSAMSLGAAIKAARPDMSDIQAKDEAKKGEKQAKESQKN